MNRFFKTILPLLLCVSMLLPVFSAFTETSEKPDPTDLDKMREFFSQLTDEDNVTNGTRVLSIVYGAMPRPGYSFAARYSFRLIFSIVILLLRNSPSRLRRQPPRRGTTLTLRSMQHSSRKWSVRISSSESSDSRRGSLASLLEGGGTPSGVTEGVFTLSLRCKPLPQPSAAASIQPAPLHASAAPRGCRRAGCPRPSAAG